jgi:hypothetical protein
MTAVTNVRCSPKIQRLSFKGREIFGEPVWTIRVAEMKLERCGEQYSVG